MALQTRCEHSNNKDTMDRGCNYYMPPFGAYKLFAMPVIIKTVPEFILIPYDVDENHVLM